MGSSSVGPDDAVTEHPLPRPLDGRAWGAVVRALALTPQQERIVRLIMRRRGNKQIARELGIALPTVRTYLGRVYRSTGVEDREELIHRVYATAIEAWARAVDDRSPG